MTARRGCTCAVLRRRGACTRRRAANDGTMPSRSHVRNAARGWRRSCSSSNVAAGAPSTAKTTGSAWTGSMRATSIASKQGCSRHTDNQPSLGQPGTHARGRASDPPTHARRRPSIAPTVAATPTGSGVAAWPARDRRVLRPTATHAATPTATDRCVEPTGPCTCSLCARLRSHHVRVRRLFLFSLQQSRRRGGKLRHLNAAASSQ